MPSPAHVALGIEARGTMKSQLKEQKFVSRFPHKYKVWSRLDKEKWKTAMKKEMQSVQRNEVWDLVKLPEGWKPVGFKWVFK